MTSQTPSVVMVSAFFPKHGGGIEHVAGHLSEHLAGDGFLVQWFAGGTPDEVPNKHIPRLSITRATSIDLLERTFGLPAPLWSATSLLKLDSAIKGAKILYIHDCLYLPSIAAFIIAKLHKKKIIITQHIGRINFRSKTLRHMHHLANQTVSRKMMELAHAVVFVSPVVRTYFSEFVKFKAPPQVFFNGVDHAVFQPSPEPPRGPKLKILFVGRFVEKKGIHYLRSCVSIPDTEWTFVGKGPLSPASWGVPMNSITLLSDLSPLQLADLYRTSDLLVLPSVGEGFPLVVQEALASGLPVLITSEVAATLGTPHPDGVFVFDEKSPNPGDELRALLCSITAGGSKLRSLRSVAKVLASQWSWEACSDRYAQLIRHL